MYPEIQTKGGSAVIGGTMQKSDRSPKRFQRSVQAYGWDSRTRTWYGPNELNTANARYPRLVDALRSAPGTSWYGPVNCPASSETGSRFFTLIHDLGDCAAAMVYCDESKTGPAEIVMVIPAERRPGLRPDLGFEFLTFASFLGCISSGAELEVGEGIAAALAETSDSESLVFSISSGLWTSDLDHVLSCCVEKIAGAMLQWLAEPSVQKHRRRC
jgi:hypothetical protein